MTDTQTAMGPISYVIVEFPGTAVVGDGFPILVDLAERGIIRILDLEFLTRDVDGELHYLDLRDIDGDGRLDLTIFEGAASGMLDDRDYADASSVIAPGSSAGVLIFEHRWATPFTEALRESGAQLVAAGFIPHDAIEASLDATET